MAPADVFRQISQAKATAGVSASADKLIRAVRAHYLFAFVQISTELYLSRDTAEYRAVQRAKERWYLVLGPLYVVDVPEPGARSPCNENVVAYHPITRDESYCFSWQSHTINLLRFCSVTSYGRDG